jgi:hypothetical protein
MPNLSRAHILKKAFPELGEVNPGAATEALIGLNTRAAEAILADLIKEFDEGYSQAGPGALVLNLAREGQPAFYLTADDFCKDLVTAQNCGDRGSARLLRDTISTVKSNEYDRQVLIMLIDKTSAHLLPVAREYPASGLQELQEQLTA